MYDQNQGKSLFFCLTIQIHRLSKKILEKRSINQNPKTQSSY